MALIDHSHKRDLLEAGWRTRGYLPHFDGGEIPQFITIRLFDSVPASVLAKWSRELKHTLTDKILLQRRIDKYLDQGYGAAFMKDSKVAALVQDTLLRMEGVTLNLWAWCVMPNHLHFLETAYCQSTLEEIMQTWKSVSSHKANKLLKRKGSFWMEEYFDRYIRNQRHFNAIAKYIENNPVKAGLCDRPEDWPFSSAWFRARMQP